METGWLRVLCLCMWLTCGVYTLLQVNQHVWPKSGQAHLCLELFGAISQPHLLLTAIFTVKWRLSQISCHNLLALCILKKHLKHEEKNTLFILACIKDDMCESSLDVLYHLEVNFCAFHKICFWCKHSCILVQIVDPHFSMQASAYAIF